MLPFLEIGPFSFPTAGLSLLLGVWLGLTLVERYAPHFGLSAETLYRLSMAGLLSGLVGARLTYLIRYPAAFAASPSSLISPNPGLLDLTGGLIIAGLAALIFGQRRQLPFWRTLDAFTPAFAVLLASVAIAHLAAGTAYGAPADLPWSVFLWGAERHPTQVYELILSTLILIAVWPGRRWQIGLPSGALFLVFLSASAGGRIFLGAFRGDSKLILGGLRAGQVGAWFILAISLFLLGRRLFRERSVRIQTKET